MDPAEFEAAKAEKLVVITQLLSNSKSIFDRVLNLRTVYPNYLSFKNDEYNVKVMIAKIKSAANLSTSPKNVNRCYCDIVRTFETELQNILDDIVPTITYDENIITDQSYFLNSSEFPGLLLKLFWFKTLLEVH